MRSDSKQCLHGQQYIITVTCLGINDVSVIYNLCFDSRNIVHIFDISITHIRQCGSNEPNFFKFMKKLTFTSHGFVDINLIFAHSFSYEFLSTLSMLAAVSVAALDCVCSSLLQLRDVTLCQRRSI